MTSVTAPVMTELDRHEMLKDQSMLSATPRRLRKNQQNEPATEAPMTPVTHAGIRNAVTRNKKGNTMTIVESQYNMAKIKIIHIEPTITNIVISAADT